MTLRDPGVQAELDSIAARTAYGLADIADEIKTIEDTYAQRAQQIQDEQAQRMQQVVDEAAKAQQQGNERSAQAGWPGSRADTNAATLDFSIDDEPAPLPPPVTAPRQQRVQRPRRPPHADEDEDFSSQTWLR
jgi:hypothetical protein